MASQPDPINTNNSNDRQRQTNANVLKLDEAAIDQARRRAEQGAPTNTEGDSQYKDSVVKLLNDALATELVCALRYKRHHFTAHGLASPTIADEFLVHANEETAHADRLARRIVQLGGDPDFSPDSLTSRSHAAYDESLNLKTMIKANLVAELVAIETYTQMIRLVGDRDPGTRRLLEDVLADEQEHADDLQGWLAE